MLLIKFATVVFLFAAVLIPLLLFHQKKISVSLCNQLIGGSMMALAAMGYLYTILKMH